MILTESGEIGVFTDAGEALLRPSLYAMSRIGTPVEIVEQFALVMADPDDPQVQRRQAAVARSVIFCCGRESDQALLFDAFGHLDGDLAEVPGQADPGHLLPLARCLLKHGITGAWPAEGQPGEGDYSRTFEAREYVALAMAHLGLPEREAWDLTMTALLGALRAKFPAQEKGPAGSRAPTKSEMEATLDWHDRVLELRKKQAAERTI